MSRREAPARPPGSHPLRPILEPRSVAIVGASADRAKRGHQVIAALRASGFPGTVYPVNPKGGEILGLPVFGSVDELPEAPDLAYVALPAAATPDAVGSCGERGIRGAVVPAVGFGESGPEGAELEARLLEAARRTGIRVVGPNTSGLLNTHGRLHLVGGEPLAPGALAILAQSGNIALDLITTASSRPVGVSIYVGPGNEIDVAFHEYLDFLGGHEPTRAIVMYVEGVKDGRTLYETARRVCRAKPVVVHKGARSSPGRRAALSHTGAIAGSHEVFVALAREAGMIVVDRSDELLPVAEALATQPASGPGGGVVVLSDGGGHATLAADRLADAGVPLARLQDETRTALRELLGPAANVRNPVDCAGATDRDPALFARLVEVASSDPACAGVLLIGLFGGYAIRFASDLAEVELAAAESIAGTVRAAGLPLVVHSLYASRGPAPLTRLLERGVPVFGSLEIAARAMAALRERAVGGSGGSAARSVDAPSPAGGERPFGRDVAPTGATPLRAGSWLSEAAVRELLEPYGAPLAPAALCRTPAEAGAAAGPGPCAIKAVSAHLPHKTEAGAVELGIEGPGAAAEAYRRVADSARRFLAARGRPAEIEGALVGPMQPQPIGELLIAATRDGCFGPILTIGRGGTNVELYRDVSIRALPTEAADIRRACMELALWPRLAGHRGGPVASVDAIVETAAALGRALLETPGLAEIELNPVFVYADRAVTIDATARIVDV